VIEREFVLSTGVLDEEYSFVLTDDAGNRHEVGPLVDEVLSVRRSAAELRSQPQRGADPRDLMSGSLAVLVISGIEIGVFTTVRMLYGDNAADTFRVHCNAVERFLTDSDGVRQ